MSNDDRLSDSVLWAYTDLPVGARTLAVDVRAMAHELLAARAEIDRLNAERSEWRARWVEATDRADRNAAERDAARAEAERLRAVEEAARELRTWPADLSERPLRLLTYASDVRRLRDALDALDETRGGQ